MGKLNWFSSYLYIFVYISQNCKIFHQSILLPGSEKNFKWFSILPNGKKYQIEKLKNMFISTKWKKWSNFLYFSTNWTSFPQSGKHFIIAIYFHEMQKKLSNFLYFFIHISFHFHEVDYISPMRFISTK